MICPKPYEFIGFGDIQCPKPCEFIGFGDTQGPKPYEFIRFGDSHSPKPYEIIGFSEAQQTISQLRRRPIKQFRICDPTGPGRIGPRTVDGRRTMAVRTLPPGPPGRREQYKIDLQNNLVFKGDNGGTLKRPLT